MYLWHDFYNGFHRNPWKRLKPIMDADFSCMEGRCLFPREIKGRLRLFALLCFLSFLKLF